MAAAPPDHERTQRRRSTFLRILSADRPREPRSVVATPLLDLAIGSSDAAVAVTTLYREVLGREADTDGLKAWTTNIRSGMSVRAVAQAFVTSPEFGRLAREHREGVLDQLGAWDARRYLAELGVAFRPTDHTYREGRVSDEVFVRALFEVALHRSPTEGELEHELTKLATGTSREWLIRAFANNPATLERSVGQRRTGLRALLRHRRDRAAHLAGFRNLVALAEHRQLTVLIDLAAGRPHVLPTAPTSGRSLT
ncbi:DUF4214 domain-containing protein [Cellulomonas sp. SG140]|uniref:DUF4214 domain-containing protein n=1 Tax=Cellulomonas sp. SG140 TaxID=2976536 RepID=UPI0021E98D99|nr:DUF4214 domain-containing protein [Cellulomonas sp. SG140]